MTGQRMTRKETHCAVCNFDGLVWTTDRKRFKNTRMDTVPLMRFSQNEDSVYRTCVCCASTYHILHSINGAFSELHVIFCQCSCLVSKYILDLLIANKAFQHNFPLHSPFHATILEQASHQPRLQGLLAFQYGGGRKEDFSPAADILEKKKTLGTRLASHQIISDLYLFIVSYEIGPVVDMMSGQMKFQDFHFEA